MSYGRSPLSRYQIPETIKDLISGKAFVRQMERHEARCCLSEGGMLIGTAGYEALLSGAKLTAAENIN